MINRAIYMVLGIMILGVPVVAQETITGVNLTRAEFPYTNWSEWDEQLHQSAANVGINEDDVRIIDEPVISDMPIITLDTWKSQAMGAGNFIVFSHGPGDGAFVEDSGVLAEVYSSVTARNASLKLPATVALCCSSEHRPHAQVATGP